MTWCRRGRSWPACRIPREALAVYRRLSPLTQLKGGRTKDHKEFVAEATEQLCMFLTATLAPQLADGVRLLLLSLDRTYQAAKARAGGLDFNDLQLTVWRLLHDHPEVIVALRSRLSHLHDRRVPGYQPPPLRHYQQAGGRRREHSPRQAVCGGG